MVVGEARHTSGKYEVYDVQGKKVIRKYLLGESEY